jgi:hypothetical protein
VISVAHTVGHRVDYNLQRCVNLISIHKSNNPPIQPLDGLSMTSSDHELIERIQQREHTDQRALGLYLGED